MEYQKIIDQLSDLANTDIAEHSQRFFKTGVGEYGFGDKFLGIRVPVIRQVVKQYKAASLGTVKKLLRSQYHEVRLFALLFLVSRFSRGNPHEQKEIYNLYLRHTQYINNWDLVDSSAYHVIGTYLENRDRSILYDLAESNVMWERRIAIIATFSFIRKNQFDDTLSIAKRLLRDPEDLIHKAVGWMLREIGKRDLTVERKFLKEHYKKMPRIMLRYAIEKFDQAERIKYLNNLN